MLSAKRISLAASGFPGKPGKSRRAGIALRQQPEMHHQPAGRSAGV